MATLLKATRSKAAGITSSAEDVGAMLVRQAEAASERLQSLANQLREALPSDRLSSLVREKFDSATGYLSEREPSELGRDVVDLVRRYPVQTMLIGAGLGWALSRWLRQGGAAKEVGSTRLKDVMTRHVEVVRPDAPLKDAAARMAELNIGTVPVCDGDRLVGMLTDRDIAIRAVARGADPSSPVREVMSSTVRYCFEDEPVQRAVETMKQSNIRRLPILDREQRLAGIVSLGDLAVEANKGAAGDVLERVSAARPNS